MSGCWVIEKLGLVLDVQDIGFQGFRAFGVQGFGF